MAVAETIIPDTVLHTVTFFLKPRPKSADGRPCIHTSIIIIIIVIITTIIIITIIIIVIIYKTMI